MARAGVTLMCYWNGKMTNGPQGISYEGAAPKPVRVSYEITYNELLDKMYGITGFDKQQFNMKIICKYPACREFIPVPIDDDESIDIIFDVARQPGTNCMELYLQREPIHNDNEAIVIVRNDSQVNVTVPVCINNQTPVEVANRNANADRFLDPGPINNSVLVLQEQHRSEAIWAGQDPGVLTCRQRLGTMMREWQLDQRIRQFIIQSGFYGVYRVGFIPLDWPLITALVERWRQETHTFHFAVGESTVTLQDIAVLLGLRIHGHAVTGSANLQWDDLCEELLGVRPDPSVLHGSTLKLSWLRAHFLQPPPDADDVTLKRHARAYILGLMGGVLFADKSGSDVQLIFLPLLRDFEYAGQISWGSGALAHLYRELCRASRMGASEISGPLILLQLWAWERLHIGRPERFSDQVRNSVVPGEEAVGDVAPVVGDLNGNEEPLPADPLGCRWKSPVIRRDNPLRALIFYRDQLDQQTDDQMLWKPYTSEVLGKLPDVCVRDQHLWRTIVPLICFDIVEWHRPDRVLRQFGLRQGIPVHCDTKVNLHAVDRRGRHHYNWKVHHKQYLQLWADPQDNIAAGEPEERPMHYHDPYMEWYRNITRRLITPLTQTPHKRFQPTSGTTHLLIESLTNIHNQCTTTLDAFTGDGARQALTDIQSMCTRVLQMIGEARHLEARPAPTPSPPHDSDKDGASQPTHEKVPPPQAPRPVTTRVPSVRERGRGKGRGRGRGTRQTTATATTGSTHSSPPSVTALLTAPPNGGDIEVPSSLNPEEATLPAASLDPLEDEAAVDTAPLQPNTKDVLSELTQAESSQKIKPKKKRKSQHP